MKMTIDEKRTMLDHLAEITSRFTIADEQVYSRHNAAAISADAVALVIKFKAAGTPERFWASLTDAEKYGVVAGGVISTAQFACEGLRREIESELNAGKGGR
jgi:hypothetical protein